MSEHAESCRSLEFTGGIQWPCDCGRDRHDAEMADIHHRLSQEQRRSATLDAENATLRDQLSEIVHLDSTATLGDAQEIAYSAMQRAAGRK